MGGSSQANLAAEIPYRANNTLIVSRDDDSLCLTFLYGLIGPLNQRLTIDIPQGLAR
jgi:hypothetical protein